MQFGVIPPVRMGVTADPAWMTSFARHAEACGFESSCWWNTPWSSRTTRAPTPMPRRARCPCPTTAGIPDPLDLMAFLAAVTERITLATGVLVIPNHQPVVLAKRSATVDVLSGGRVRLCVGVGWMDEELRATGADPRTRGRRTDETIAACGSVGRLGAGRAPTSTVSSCSFHRAHSFPKPVRPGGVPIHIGGHSEAAARRAGRLGDGFQPLGLVRETWRMRMAQVRESAEEAGRDPAAIELSLSGYLPTTTDEEVAEAEAAGASRLVVSTSMSADLARSVDELSAFAERFGRPPGRPRSRLTRWTPSAGRRAAVAGRGGPPGAVDRLRSRGRPA